MAFRRRAGSTVWLAKPTGSCKFRYMSAIEEIQKTVLALPLEQRVFLAESLLQSLPPLTDQMSEAEEMKEVERRENEIETGKVQTVGDRDFWRSVEADRKR